MFFDPMYFVFIGPGLLLSLWASYRVKANFKKYSRVPSVRGRSGAQVAAELMRQAGVSDVRVVRARGMLSDHYNPVNKTLALSDGVHDSTSVAAISIAAHEAGHALQHAQHYAPLWARSALVPTVNIGSMLGYIVMLAGFFLTNTPIFIIGVGLFSMVLLFQLVTLPVEFDASRRAKKILFAQGFIADSERAGVARVLNAAALTYVAAAVATLMTVLYYLWIFFGRRD